MKQSNVLRELLKIAETTLKISSILSLNMISVDNENVNISLEEELLTFRTDDFICYVKYENIKDIHVYTYEADFDKLCINTKFMNIDLKIKKTKEEEPKDGSN